MPDPVTPEVVVNLITHNPKNDEVTLVLVETQRWGAEGERIPALRAKLDSYLLFVVSGQFARNYPKLSGNRVRLRIDTHSPMGMKEVAFLYKYRIEQLEPRGIGFDIHEVGVRSFLKRTLRKK